MQIDPREMVAVAMNAHTQAAEARGTGEVVLGAFAVADGLGRVLWRMRYGELAFARGLDQAAILLAKRLRSSVRGRGLRDRWLGVGEGGSDVFLLVARRAVWEWMHDKCSQCGGQVVASIPDAEHVLGARAFSCAACRGTGRARYSDASRALALGLTKDVFIRNWRDRLLGALALLDRYDGDVEVSVRSQLRPLAQSK